MPFQIASFLLLLLLGERLELFFGAKSGNTSCRQKYCASIIRSATQYYAMSKCASRNLITNTQIFMYIKIYIYVCV